MSFGFAPKNLDPRLLWSTGLLLMIGLVMVASASVAVSEKLTGTTTYFFNKQLIFAVIGLAGAAALISIPLEQWEKASFWLLALSMLLLILVLFPGVGREVNGSQRWLNLGVAQVQASEPARIALFLYLCGYAVRRRDELRASWTGLAKPLLPLAVAVALMLLEPDFGSAAVMMAVAMLVLFIAGARIAHLAVLGVVGLGLFAALIAVAPYRLARLAAYRNPWEHAYDSGFQLTQSLIAIGRGEWFGVGLGNSVQKLLYLPETHTDFIFAVFAEEFGLLGVVALLSLLAYLGYVGLSIARSAAQREQMFGSYLAFTLTSWLILQALLNIGVNMGVLPTKGLPLPLISYGGSSLVTTLAALALIQRVGIEAREAGGAP